MALAHLHPLRWDAPLGRLQVDLGPLGAAQFPGAQKHERRKRERRPGLGLTLVAVECAQQLAHLHGLRDRGPVRRDDGRERVFQRCGDIVFGAPGGDGEAVDLTDFLFYPVRGLMVAGCLDPAQHPQQIGRLDISERPAPDGGEHQVLENPSGLAARRRRELPLALSHPFARHRLQRVRDRAPLGPTSLARVDAIGDEPPRVVALASCASERDIRVGTE